MDNCTMNVQRKEEVIQMIDSHFSHRGNTQRFINWAAKKGIKIQHSQITRAKNGSISAFSALVFLVYLDKVKEFE